MSTKSTLSVSRGTKKEHKLQWHIFKDMHEPDGSVVVELSCSTCNCFYQFLMSEHLGKQLADIFEKETDDESKQESIS